MGSGDTSEGHVTLNQMMSVLDKDIASSLGRKLKKLTKKSLIQAPLDDNKAELIKRQAGYREVTKDVSQWDPVIERTKQTKQIKFPLDQQPDYLPSTSDTIAELKPRNELETQIYQAIRTSDSALRDQQEFTKAEEKYLKAISVEEAKSRHLELQKMRVLLSSYAAKMRRQKAIKSKSYRRLLKQERLKKHMKKVESDKDLLLDEIRQLQKLRAHERATLKHKNTGKWAKHAKFRAKYDEEARQAMIEQIGLASKLLQKPVEAERDSDDSESNEDEDFDSDEDVIKNDDSDESSVGDDEIERRLKAIREEDDEIKKKMKEAEPEAEDDKRPQSQLIVSSDLISDRVTNKGKSTAIESGDLGDASDVESESEDGDNYEDDNQRRLMSEAFADDDVVSDFRKAKEALANEEQPKDINLFLPGWGDWAGPGIKVNKRKQKKYTIKAKRRPRKDDNLGNVIISEDADTKINELMVKNLPRELRNNKKFERAMDQPVTGTFTNQTTHREVIRPKIATKMGARIEPVNKEKVLRTKQAKWV